MNSGNKKILRYKIENKTDVSISVLHDGKEQIVLPTEKCYIEVTDTPKDVTLSSYPKNNFSTKLFILRFKSNHFINRTAFSPCVYSALSCTFSDKDIQTNCISVKYTTMHHMYTQIFDTFDISPVKIKRYDFLNKNDKRLFKFFNVMRLMIGVILLMLGLIMVCAGFIPPVYIPASVLGLIPIIIAGVVFKSFLRAKKTLTGDTAFLEKELLPAVIEKKTKRYIKLTE